MREIAVPALTDLDPAANLTDLVVRNAREAPQQVAFRRPVDGVWQDITCARVPRRGAAAGPRSWWPAGVNPGDRVGLMSKTRYEWTLADFAIWFAGAVTVPIYETSSAEQVAWILSDSGAVACFTEIRRARRDRRRGPRLHCPPCDTCGCSRPARSRSWVAAGSEVPADRDSSVAAATLTGVVAGDDHLHLRHDRASQGLRADPRQLRRPGRQHGRQPRLESSAPTAPPPCCSCRWPTSSPGSSRCCASRPGRSWGTPPTSRTCSTTWLPSARPSCSPSPGSSRRSTTPPRRRPRPRARAESSRRPPTPPSPGARLWTPAGPGLALRLRHALFDRLVYRQATRARSAARSPYAVSGGAPLGARLGPLLPGHRSARSSRDGA